MMVSNKGTMLDLHKQLITLGLKIKKCAGIKSSNSTEFQKLVLDKKLLESDEQRAIMRMLLIIK